MKPIQIILLSTFSSVLSSVTAVMVLNASAGRSPAGESSEPPKQVFGLEAVLTAPPPPARGPDELEQDCGEFPKKFCSGLTKETGLGGCLIAHYEKLPPLCQQHLQYVKKIRSICGSDMQKFCNKVEQGAPMRKCMREALSQLSKGCRASVEKWPQ